MSTAKTVRDWLHYWGYALPDQARRELESIVDGSAPETASATGMRSLNGDPRDD